MPINKYTRGMRPNPGPVLAGGDSIKTRYAPGEEERMYAEAVGSGRAKMRRAFAPIGGAANAPRDPRERPSPGFGQRIGALTRAASEGFPGLRERTKKGK